METPGVRKTANWMHPAVVIATGWWFGRMPVAPGTFGALLGLPLAWGISVVESPWLQIAIIAILFAVSVPICTAAAEQLGGKKDPGAIVLDEIVSLPVTFFLVPREQLERPWVLVAGFVLHRLFDITKPPPARQLEHLPTGLGIMADDIAAGIYSWIGLHLLINWLGIT
ncbi:MAG: phosphatidylglycerophosphatase A [Pirellulales bacterium]|nr:phosphatidylglycerophosphatase A [Pirellulales bacterium]